MIVYQLINIYNFFHDFCYIKYVIAIMCVYVYL